MAASGYGEGSPRLHCLNHRLSAVVFLPLYAPSNSSPGLFSAPRMLRSGSAAARVQGLVRGGVRGCALRAGAWTPGWKLDYALHQHLAGVVAQSTLHATLTGRTCGNTPGRFARLGLTAFNIAMERVSNCRLNRYSFRVDSVGRDHNPGPSSDRWTHRGFQGSGAHTRMQAAGGHPVTLCMLPFLAANHMHVPVAYHRPPVTAVTSLGSREVPPQQGEGPNLTAQAHSILQSPRAVAEGPAWAPRLPCTDVVRHNGMVPQQQGSTNRDTSSLLNP